MLFILFAVCSLTGVIGQKSICGGDSLCPFDICPVYPPVTHSFPVTKEQYEAFCEAILDYYTCFHENKDSFEWNNLTKFPLVLQKAEKFLTKTYCKPTFRARFLNHTECLKDVNELVANCQLFTNNQIEIYEKDPPCERNEYKASNSCMWGSLWFVCMAREVKSLCGDEAEKVYVEAMDGLLRLASYCNDGLNYRTAFKRAKLVMGVTKVNPHRVSLVQSQCPRL